MQYSLKQQFKNTKERKKRQRSAFKTTEQQDLIKQKMEQTQIFNIISKCQDNGRKKLIKDQFLKYYGKNYPINYKDSYQVEEQWQNKMFYEFKKLKSLVNQENLFEVIILALTIITYSLTIWLSTIEFYFVEQKNVYLAQQLTWITLIIHILKIMHQLANDFLREKRQWKISQIIHEYKGSIIILLYLIMKIILSLNGINRNTIIFYLETPCLIVLYFSARKIYESLRYMNFSLRHEYHTKIFDMIITIFITAHIISIPLIEATRMNPNLNWMTHLDIESNNYLVKYIYTFYFTITTILTVGYGDITPKNPLEVIIVILVEIFGIVIFGYVVNEIGYCISSLKKNRQIIDKDLTVIEKIKQQYKMDSHSVNKMVSFVMNNKDLNDKLIPQEEQNVLNKLNDKIRQDIMKTNLSTIVKHSIFFLCRWSKYFQNNVSMKLTHALYSPNDILAQIKGKEKIYLIKSGKINIHADRSDGKKTMGMLLKTIQNNKQKQIYDNCYGYTAVISDRPFNLYAISKDFTSAYYIEKADFIQCAKQKLYDFEYFHEIKAKLQQSVLNQVFEAKILDSSRHHYNPSRTFLLKKNRTQNNTKNKRKNYLRNEKALDKGRYCYEKEMAIKIRDVFVSSMNQIQITETDEPIVQNIAKCLIKRVGSFQASSAPKINSSGMLDSKTKKKMESQNNFQSGKQYQNYFSKKNISKVLKKYETQVINLYPKKIKKNDLKQSKYPKVKMI